MTIDREMLLYIAQLAALDIEPGESKELERNLTDILGYVNRIQGHELTPSSQAEIGVLRRQDQAKTYPPEPLFEVAPRMQDRLFSTPVVTHSLSEKALPKDHQK
jgi:aspartyl/glutamyl-tRNA(Asn/Gln) amidotransferase C subunit